MPDRSNRTREYHIVVLGAGGVGKSCLTTQFVQGVFVESYDPTIEDSYTRMVTVDGRLCQLQILDTAGTEQFTAMRELYMRSGKGFILVFSITSSQSLRELMDLHSQLLRIKDNDASLPIVLVGNKSDLEQQRAVPSERAFAVSQRWGNKPYYETSAKKRVNVEEVFQDLCRQIIRRDMDDSSAGGSAGSGGDRAGRGRERYTFDSAGNRQSRRRNKRGRKRRDTSSCVIL